MSGGCSGFGNFSSPSIKDIETQAGFDLRFNIHHPSKSIQIAANTLISLTSGRRLKDAGAVFSLRQLRIFFHSNWSQMAGLNQFGLNSYATRHKSTGQAKIVTKLD